MNGLSAPSDGASEIYDARYERGYMDGWSGDRKKRIFDLIRGLSLPPEGRALDFGCGNGLLTEVIRRALPPGWRVYGTDISKVAVGHARAWFPHCTFFSAGEPVPGEGGFDLVFTHHVLEHVEDLDATLAHLASVATERATVVHILPCGNEGSLEHRISRLRRDGIDPARGNRFFFEEPGHLRRLTTADLETAHGAFGFELSTARYANHDAGAVEWITQSGPSFLRTFTDPAQAVDPEARAELGRLRRRILSLWLLRYPSAFVDQRLRTRSRRWWEAFLLPVGLLLYPASKPVDLAVKARARAEWRDRCQDPSGSEMYLCFERRTGRPGDDAASPQSAPSLDPLGKPPVA